jgi:hypothetical protein
MLYYLWMHGADMGCYTLLFFIVLIDVFDWALLSILILDSRFTD